MEHKIDTITLKNIDLTGIDLEEQRRKVVEEEKEFMDAFFRYTISKTEENKNHVIEELYDEFQSKLGLLEKEGIKSKEVQAYYPKHIEKLKKRGNKPREKKCSKCINCETINKQMAGQENETGMYCYKKHFILDKEYAKECKCYEEVGE